MSNKYDVDRTVVDMTSVIQLTISGASVQLSFPEAEDLAKTMTALMKTRHIESYDADMSLCSAGTPIHGGRIEIDSGDPGVLCEKCRSRLNDWLVSDA